MSSQPLVSVICLCYNHERFIEEAIQSVLQQTYHNIEIIVVDDASSDSSRKIIEQLVRQYPQIRFIPLERNVGNCKAFNIGLQASKGEYIIDLATDDVLLPERVEAGVKALEEAGDHFGVTIANCEIIDEEGNFVQYHYPIDGQGKSKMEVPEGDVFLEVIRRYFICPPTVMFKRQVIEQLGGYDEQLTYEDFDFWIRSSRHFKYNYVDQVLVKKRIVRNSLSRKQFSLGSGHTRSTYLVCKKASKLVRTKEEATALKKRLYYEVRVAIRLLNLREVWSYLRLILSL
ncbi:glycosyl transferase [Fulvivirga imtechensis AK7]|uniref:Glycosyl transferase n=1 Tax=Fulvivirga imtechensis AK7 TaxID=1237149 RepID=L8JN63_9BACT|nr:glycosyltransferase [Fulvivirga imtechensis]ELR70381.1 glycosyl transferase [Fulvivirga imtechensis AK7]